MRLRSSSCQFHFSRGLFRVNVFNVDGPRPGKLELPVFPESHLQFNQDVPLKVRSGNHCIGKLSLDILVTRIFRA